MSQRLHDDGCVRLEEGFGPGAPEPNECNGGILTPTPITEPQLEQHSQHSGLVRDAIIGLADGLTVPFALTAGLSS
jgi:VIT family